MRKFRGYTPRDKTGERKKIFNDKLKRITTNGKLYMPKLKNPGIENRGGSRVMSTPSLSNILKRRKMR